MIVYLELDGILPLQIEVQLSECVFLLYVTSWVSISLHFLQTVIKQEISIRHA